MVHFTRSIMKLLFVSIASLLFICGGVYGQIQYGQDIDGIAAGDSAGYSVSMPDRNTIAIGSPGSDSNGQDAGQTRIFSWNGVSWVQKGQDIDGVSVGDKSGHSISMPDPNTVAIGAYMANSLTGQVQIYRWNGTAWIQKGQTIIGEAQGDSFGYSVSMSDSTSVVIGAPRYDVGSSGNTGHTRVYTWNNNMWEPKGDEIIGEHAGDYSGWSVSMADPNTIAIGGPGNDANNMSGTGHVRVYRWNGAEWNQKGEDIDGDTSEIYAGWSVSMPNANVLALGATAVGPNTSFPGQVRVYYWSETDWVQYRNDIYGEMPGDAMGYSVSMPDSSTLAIGAPLNGASGIDAGHTRVYSFRGVHSSVYNDLNNNCIREEQAIVVGVLGLIEPSNLLVESDSNGLWSIDSVALGNYTITYDTSGAWRASCANPRSFVVSDPDNQINLPSFGMIPTDPCPAPRVSVVMPAMRPGFDRQRLHVEARNMNFGSAVLDSAYVILKLDDLITLDSANAPFIALGNNQFRFDLGQIDPREKESFMVWSTVSINTVIGQTLLLRAEMFPQSGCLFDSTTPAPAPFDFTPCTLPWDGSEISLDGWCHNGGI